MVATADNGTIYNFRYRHGVDEKRRVQLPMKWRPLDPATEFTLTLWPKPEQGPCLRVLPRAQFDKLLADIEARPGTDPNKGFLKRYLGSWSTQVTLDKTGRICIPEELAKKAGIEPNVEVMLVGLMNLIEIWSSDRFAKLSAVEDEQAPGAFQGLE
jgi:MraZ protein